MTILCLVMEFPPMASAGVFRPLRFIKGLREHGYKPVVITFEIDEYIRKEYKKFDDQLLDQLPDDIPVYRIPLNDLHEFYNSRMREFINIYFTLSDNYAAAWRDNVFSMLPEIIARHQPQGIYATAPPFSASVLAAEISVRYQLPLVQDMRDAWAKLSMAPLGSYFHYLAKCRMERRAFKQASAIITVTPQLKKMFRDTHPGMAADKFHLIYNSFDFDLPSSLTVQAEGIGDRAEFHIGYVGAFYYAPENRAMMMQPWYKKKGHRMLQYTPVKEDWLYRSPYFFFRSLKRLIDQRPEWKNKIFFHHVGDTPPWLADMAKETGVSGNLVLHGFQPLEKTLALQQGFDLLLATSEKVIGKEHYCLPSKLFTYLRSEKPALAFLTKGVQHEFIEKSRMGVIADPDNEEAGAAVIEKLVLQGYRAAVDMQYLKQFERGQAVQQLITIFNKTFAPKHSPVNKAVTI